MRAEQFHTRRGAALLAAVTLLAVFSMLGVAYLKYMSIEDERVTWRTRVLRAETLAADYLTVAIHETGQRLAQGQAIPDELAYPAVPVYIGGRAGPESLVDSEALRAEIRVRVFDEAAKLDLNRAAPWLIRAVTGLDAEKAERIRDNARPPLVPDAIRLPLRTLEELKTRGIVDAATYDALPLNQLTVFSGPGPLLNANSMPVDMLAVVLRTDTANAESIAAARPFASRDELESALPSGVTLPPAVTAGSRCYRLVCEVTMMRPALGDVWRPERSRRLEAVVAFGAEQPRVLHWQPVDFLDDDVSASRTVDYGG